MEQKIIYIGIAVVVVLGLVYVLWPKPSVATVSLNLMGMPIYLHPVQGQDVPCIGAPDGYTRVYFSDDSDEGGKYVTVGYAREGDHYEEALSWGSTLMGTFKGLRLWFQKDRGDFSRFPRCPRDVPAL